MKSQAPEGSTRTVFLGDLFSFTAPYWTRKEIGGTITWSKNDNLWHLEGKTLVLRFFPEHALPERTISEFPKARFTQKTTVRRCSLPEFPSTVFYPNFQMQHLKIL